MSATALTAKAVEPLVNVLDESHVCNFLSRVQALQRLCSDSDGRYPCGLLFVPGPDGRHNKGSVNILKYLFHGATGKYLLDGTIEADFDDLEESVLLIQQSSVSVFWNGPAKKLIGPLLRKVPFLIEYAPTPEEEEDVDKFQMRKCIDFKRMILEAVPEGRGIGIPIPLGYEEINEIEGWPILQAFAMDSVYCPSGFFTARYVVADVTEYIDVMFRAVDGFSVGSIINVMKKSIVPHMDQFVDILDTVTADQRSRLTAEDVLGPLDMLFDFGELECAFPCDPAKKPLLLFGSDTNKIGETVASATDSSKMLGDSLHIIVEACEPSCGVRWCRTYFLNYGKAVPFLPVHLVEQYDNSGVSADGLPSPPTSFESVDSENSQSIARLQTLYYTLVSSLKAVVMYAFSNNVDVFEAGTFIQKSMDDLLKGGNKEFSHSSSNDGDSHARFFSEIASSITPLKTGEWLQLHMDCMNALGEVIGIEDVDDMGGSCLMYIRASIHGINLPNKTTGTVSVGDTFLFSVNSGRLLDLSPTSPTGIAISSASAGGGGGGVGKATSMKRSPFALSSLHPYVGDCFCLTHVLPYFKVYFGSGPEEASAQRLLSFSRNPHNLSSLGLGKMIEVLSVGTLSVPILTDNKALPYFMSSDVRVFSEGFIIEKLGVSCLPILISTNIHIAEMWIVDAAEALSQSMPFAPAREKFDHLPDFYSPNGNLMIFRMRKFDAGDNRVDDDTSQFDDQDISIRRALQSNPIASALAYQDDCEYIAMFIPTGSRAAQVLSQCTSMWRSVLQAINVPIHRGADSNLPQCMLISYLALLDKWSHNCEESFFNTVLDERSPLSYESFVSILASCGSASAFHSLSSRVPALGFLPLLCVHAYSESIRMRPGASASALSSSYSTDVSHVEAEKGYLIVVSGLPGSGVISAGLQIYERMKMHSISRSADITYHYVDIAMFSALEPQSDVNDYVKSCLENNYSNNMRLANSNSTKSGLNQKKCICIVVVIQSPTFHVQQSSLLNVISQILNAKVGPTITVMSPKCFNLMKPTISLLADGAETEIGKFGDEMWRAAHAELCQESLASIVIFIDDNKSSDAWKSWMVNNNPSVTNIRLNPLLLRLEDDFFDDLVEGFGIQGKENQSSASSSTALIRLARGVLDQNETFLSSESSSRDHQQHLHLNSRRSSFELNSTMGRDAIRHICIRPSTSTAFWEITNLVRSLLLIFPTANVNTTNVQNTWNVPDRSENLSWWQRCIQLARIKALTNLRVAKGRELYDAWSVGFVSAQAKEIQALRNKTYSIHGFCRISKGEITTKHAANSKESHESAKLSSSKAKSSSTGIWLHVEANVGNIIIKVIENKRENLLLSSALPIDIIGSDMLLATGLLNKDDVSLLDKIFAASEQVNMRAVSLISPCDVSREMKFKIQQEAAHIPLVKTWYDGNSYVDVHGTRCEFRPDIDALVQNYVDYKNRSLTAYNEIILECFDYI